MYILYIFFILEKVIVYQTFVQYFDKNIQFYILDN